jgi:hypothetical protein
MTDEEYKKLHPILSATTENYVSLYTNAPNEKNRQKLIKLEALLHEKLEALQKARDEDN